VRNRLFPLACKAGCFALLLVYCGSLSAQSSPAASTNNFVTKEDALTVISDGKEASISKERLRPQGIYLGIGAGLSSLRPSLKGVSGHTLEDDDSASGQFMFGIDVSSRVSVEVHTGYLGEAEFGPSGSLRYRVHGLSGLYYLSRTAWQLGRVRLNGFLRAGGRYLDLSERRGAKVRAENRANLLFGAGLELNTRSPISARLDAISFSKDARYLQASLLYRFGQRGNTNSNLTVEPSVIVINILNVGSPLPASSEMNAAIDTDADTVDPIEFGQDVNFRNDSHHLTLNAKRLLDDVVGDMRINQHERVKVIAHTDSNGSDSYNLRLSERRAKSVVDYLLSRGVTLDRLDTTSVGESEPIAPNSSSLGRSKNRRVEVFTEAR